MSTFLIDAQREEAWRATAGHRFSSLFSSTPWIEAVARTYDFKIMAAAHVRGGKIEGAVPFSRVTDIRGDRIVCLPFSDYCDPLVENAAAWQELIEPILALAAPVTLRCLRNSIPMSDNRFAITGRGMWHGVDLTRPEDELWARLSGSARQNVRKAERSGIVIREGNSLDDVLLFHHMHCHLRKSKYQLFAQPVAFFENLHQSFAPHDGITVLLAEDHTMPIAGIFLLRWGDTLYYKFNASIDQRLCPNDLLVWRSILLGRRRSSVRLDLGLSGIDQPGLIRYKSKFATEQREICFLRSWPRGYSDPRGEQATQLLSCMTRLLTDPSVPDEVTRAAGDELYRFFC